METDVQYGVSYPDPVQGGNEPVTRQRGLDLTQQVGFDPQPPKEIIQGDPGVVAYRNPGNGSQKFASDGTLHSDHRSDDNILFVDHALSDPDMAPGLARTNAPIAPRSSTFGEMAAVEQRAAIKAQAEAMGFVVLDAPAASPAAVQPPAIDVIASDQPGDHADPRDKSTRAQVFGADQLPVIKKAPIVPVVLPTPKVRRVRAKAAPKGKK
jgi:hypothetical protein